MVIKKFEKSCINRKVRVLKIKFLNFFFLLFAFLKCKKNWHLREEEKKIYSFPLFTSLYPLFKRSISS